MLGDLWALTLLGVAMLVQCGWMVHRKHLDALRHDRERFSILERAIRDSQELMVQVGSGHQRSVLRWMPRSGGWTANAMALTEATWAPPPPVRCQHPEVVDVESYVDPSIILARLCLNRDCGAQLEASFEPEGSLPWAQDVLPAEEVPMLTTSTQEDWDSAIFEPEPEAWKFRGRP